MSDFKYVENFFGNSLQLKVFGSFDESAKMPPLKAGLSGVSINLGGVTRLNSHGTRTWTLWVKTIPPNLLVALEECPVLFVKSFSLIKGILPPNIEVNSFYVPYYSEATNEHTNLLFIRGQHYSNDGQVTIPELRDSRGNPMELDIVPTSYFGFLKK